MHTFFVAGTDTDVGKTIVSKLIIRQLNAKFGDTLGIKPVSAGCELTPEGLRNEDALILQNESAIKVPYEVINPIAFEPAIAPHIAAQLVNKGITLDDLQKCLARASTYEPKYLLIEGAGGWRLPLNNEGLFLSDFVKDSKIKVILVVGMKLGCLNHAILSYQAILEDGLECVGWVANHLSADMPYLQENKETLLKTLGCPLIAEVPYQGGTNSTDDISTMHVNASFLQVFS